MRETELYPPIKGFLEDQGYEVKAEIGSADVMACRDGDPPVIVELKTGFSLALIYQAIDRQSVTDSVYVAVPRGKGRAFQAALGNMKKLARRLGIGVITVRLRDCHVEVHCDPAPYRPRKLASKRDRLLREFSKRSGDPNTGGTRGGIVTAYRQDAERCAAFLASTGPSKGAIVARETGVSRATRMMADNHYGWFHRVETGIYALTDVGQAAVASDVKAAE